MGYTACVIVPVSDLRTEPTMEPFETNRHDRRRDSQVFLSTLVHVRKEEGEWCHVEVPDQMTGHFLGSSHPYQGWVQADALRPTNEVWKDTSSKEPLTDKEREQIVAYSRRFVGQPYLWGGLSSFDPSYNHCETGVDCSGLSYKAYEFVQRLLPRDAKDQWTVCQPVDQLKPGDLLFTAPDSTCRVNHVMVWSGKSLIEATDAEHRVVREVTFEEKFGIPLPAVSETKISDRALTIYLRRFPA